jgi:hypothetical protein
MKKFLALLLAVLMFASPAFAGKVPVTTIVNSVVLDADPTSVTSDVVEVADGISKVAFSVSVDETQVGGISNAATLEMSFDGTIWSAASFYDYAGGATLQTSETIAADNQTAPYIMWVNPELVAPYYRVKVTATGSDADDTAIIVVKVAQKP